MGEAPELLAATAMGACVGWATALRQLPEAARVAALMALGGAIFAIALRGMPARPDPSSIVVPVVVAAAILAAAAGARMRGSDRLLFTTGIVAAGSVGALSGADRVGPAALVSLCAVGCAVVHRRLW